MHFIPQNALVWPSLMKVRHAAVAAAPQAVGFVSQLLQSTRPAFGAQLPVVGLQNWFTGHDELSRQNVTQLPLTQAFFGTQSPSCRQLILQCSVVESQMKSNGQCSSS